MSLYIFHVSTTLHCHHLHDPVISVHIARRVAHLHAQHIPIPSRLSPVPMQNGQPCPILLHNLTSWYQLARKISMRDTMQQMRLDALQIQSTAFQNELIWLRTYLAELASPIVFCHQDLQEGNILWSPHPAHGHPSPNDIPDVYYERIAPQQHVPHEQIQCHIIDFEYAAYNYRGFDLVSTHNV